MAAYAGKADTPAGMEDPDGGDAVRARGRARDGGGRFCDASGRKTGRYNYSAKYSAPIQREDLYNNVKVSCITAYEIKTG